MDFTAPGAAEGHDGLQPSNLSPPVWGSATSVLFRLGVIAWIAAGIAALAVLVLTATLSIQELLPKLP